MATTPPRELPQPRVLLGNPRFLDSELAEIKVSRGVAAAWEAAFARHGPQAPQHVAGDFAVALPLGDGRVFLAVDRFAVRTLCYRVTEGEIFFSERADCVAGSQSERDPQAIFDYLYFHMIPAPRTVFSDVVRLPAAHSAVFENGNVAVSRYWRPQFVETRRASLDRLKQDFRDLLRTCVREQLDRPEVGCFLSGGTDSSTVAGLIGELTGRPARTFSIGFDAEGYDEMEYARVAARHFRTDHHEYYVTADDLVRHIPEVAASFDQPFGNSSVLPAYLCARIARDRGVTKLLGGDGGDELFGGNSRYAKQRVFSAYEALPRVLRTSVLEPLLLGSALPSTLPLVRKAASYVEQARVPMPDRAEMYNLIFRLGIEAVLTPEFLLQVDTTAPVADQRGEYAACAASALINRMLAFDWKYTLADNDLPKVVGATRLAGIETGFPFLDQRLVDFSLELHPEYKLRGLSLRWFFKEALRGFLPQEIIVKKKHGFGLPFGTWLMAHGGLKALALDSLASLQDRGIVRRDFLDDLVSSHLPRFPGYYGEMVWILMMLEQWLRAHPQAAHEASGAFDASTDRRKEPAAARAAP